MAYSQDEKKKIIAFYNRFIQTHGPYDPRAMNWNDKKSQVVRLTVLMEIGDMNNQSILDVGSGFGDLYGLLKEHFQSFSYKGLDINPRAITAARTKYPVADFEVADFGDFSGEKFDYVLVLNSISSVWYSSGRHFGHPRE